MRVQPVTEASAAPEAVGMSAIWADGNADGVSGPLILSRTQNQHSADPIVASSGFLAVAARCMPAPNRRW